MWLSWKEPIMVTLDLSPYKFDGPGGMGKPPHVHVLPCPDVFRQVTDSCMLSQTLHCSYFGHNCVIKVCRSEFVAATRMQCILRHTIDYQARHLC